MLEVIRTAFSSISDTEQYFSRLSAVRAVHRVITDLAVLDCTPHGFRLVECAPGVSINEVRSKTGRILLI